MSSATLLFLLFKYLYREASTIDIALGNHCRENYVNQDPLPHATYHSHSVNSNNIIIILYTLQQSIEACNQLIKVARKTFIVYELHYI